MKKLKNISGETLVETLLALMIIVLALAALPFAMQTAAKISAKSTESSNDFSYSRRDAVPMHVSISYSGREYTIPDDHITAYKDNGYVFYDYSSQTSNN